LQGKPLTGKSTLFDTLTLACGGLSKYWLMLLGIWQITQSKFPPLYQENYDERTCTCQFDNQFATITVQNGKVNAISHPMLDKLNQAFNQAENAQTIVVLTG
jgi:ribosome-binding ATPase YchF (GTP1/OBG family)